MNLYIKIVDGKPEGHPAFEENLIQAFDCVPSDFVPFERVHPDQADVTLSKYQKLSPNCDYQFIDGIWKDVHYAIDMSDEEKARVDEEEAKQKNPLIAIGKLSAIKHAAEYNIENLTDANQIDVWNQYLNILRSITIPDNLPMNNLALEVVKFPRFPKKDENGNWVPNLDDDGNWKMKNIQDDDGSRVDKTAPPIIPFPELFFREHGFYPPEPTESPQE